MDYKIFILGLILFPGVVVTSILQFFNIKSEAYNNIKFSLYTFIYGTIINIFYFCLTKENFEFKIQFNNKESIKIEDFVIFVDRKDIIILLIISTIIGIVLSFLRNSGRVHREASKYGITYETGFKNLLYSIYHSKEEEFIKASSSNVCVRLLQDKIVYYGNLIAYEVQKDYTEIFLRDVKIYLKDNGLLNIERENLVEFYERAFIYLQLKSCEFRIEYIEEDDEMEEIHEEESLVDEIKISKNKYYHVGGMLVIVIEILFTLSLVFGVRVFFD